MLSILMLAGAVTLEEAWSEAEKNNPDLALVHEQTRQLRAIKLTAWSQFQPQVNFTGNYIFNDYATEVDFTASIPEEFQAFIGESEPIILEQEKYMTWEVQATQLLFSGPAVPQLVGLYRTVDAQEIEEQDVRAQVRTGVIQAYYGVAVARQAVALADQARTNATKHMELARVQVDAGLAPPTAKLQAEIAQSRSEREWLRAKEGQTRAEQAFARLTGLDPDTAVELPPAPPMPFASVEDARSAAFAEQPGLQAAETRVSAAYNQRLATQLAWIPSVYGVYKYTFNESTGFVDDQTRWRFIISAQWSVWDGGLKVAEVLKSSSQFRSAELAVTRKSWEIEERVLTLWESYQSATAALQTVEKEASLAAENLRLAEVAFSAGSLSFMEVEDARLGLLASQLNLLSERMNRDVAVYQLMAVTGRL